MNSHSTLVDALRFASQHCPDQTAFTLLRDGDEDAEDITYARLDTEARRLAAQLRQLGSPGTRVLLISRDVAEHVRGIFGCHYAGMIPVSGLPPYPPRVHAAAARQAGRLRRFLDIMEGSGATVIVAPGALHGPFQKAAQVGGLQSLGWVDLDGLTTEPLAVTECLPPQSDEIALIQYTSGSTSRPKGVVLSHRNVIENIEMQVKVLGCGPHSRMVTWLPPYHDLGIIGGGITPVFLRFPCVAMAPVHFAESPLRWLRAMSRYRATITGAPNFAFALCAQQATEEDKRGIDLSDWTIAVNGAEPISAASIRAFALAFESCGFSPTAMAPMYGLAEATLAVTFTNGANAPRVRRLKRGPLGKGHVVSAEPELPALEAVELVSCGKPGAGVDLVIVEPTSATPLGEGRVGEIWCRSRAVALGYYGDETATGERFAAYLDNGDGPYLRTGDLGFVEAGELYFVSRLKDLIVVRGINYSPQEIEALAVGSHPILQHGAAVACSLTAVDDTEHLVVICEIRPTTTLDVTQISEAIQQVVFAELGLEVSCVVLTRLGSIPKTPSGKLQRRQCLADYLDGILPVIHEWRPSARRQAINLAESGEPPSSYDQLIARVQEALGKSDQSRANFLQMHLGDLGLDSMRLMEFAFELRRQWGVRIRSAELFELGSMEAIARRVWESMGTGAEADGPAVGAGSPHPPSPGLANPGLARLKHLRALREG